MWGIVPAAGLGTRIQALAFSKELLPVGSRMDGTVERPRAASEFLLERMALGCVTKVCFVISPDECHLQGIRSRNPLSKLRAPDGLDSDVLPDEPCPVLSLPHTPEDFSADAAVHTAEGLPASLAKTRQI